MKIMVHAHMMDFIFSMEHYAKGVSFTNTLSI